MWRELSRSTNFRGAFPPPGWRLQSPPLWGDTPSSPLARPLLAHAALSLAEIEDYKTSAREHLRGGGTFYDLTFAEFPGQP